MATLFWQQSGQGSRDLVLLHGWGLNSEVWNSIELRLAPHFRIHKVDLPGYGRSQEFGEMSLTEMSNTIFAQMPENAVLAGWSLGGLVAADIALRYPQAVSHLVTICSSPCFGAQEEEGWPGIKPTVLSGFQHQLATDFQRTVERFLALQTLGTASARQDARILKSVVLEQPMPDVAVLNAGLEILRTADLRSGLPSLTMPFLRIYGYLDGLVPRKVASLLDEQLPSSPSVVMRNSAHAPFISHPDEFCEVLTGFAGR
ncbi:TPA: pimeloyl-ACP methyl ester esterase BioH [Morganella morganii]